jgi:CheY-like chemotaxis protein
MTLTKATFVEQLTDLYQHLYDLVHLRNQEVIDRLLPDPKLRRKEKAWQVHQMLLNLVDELDPGPQAPVYSKAWRRHRLMVLRYVDGLDVRTVAQELSVSRRQYYRDHEDALQAAADILWDRYIDRPAEPEPPADEADHLELLRLEVARMAQARRYVDVAEVVTGSLALFQERLRQQGLSVHRDIADTVPSVSIDQGLLRQMLVSVLGNLVNRSEHAHLHITARAKGSRVPVTLRVDPPEAVQPMASEEADERLAAFQEMGKLCDAQVQALRHGDGVVGYEVRLRVEAQRTVLVVDDNRDILELFQRYLSTQAYQTLTAQSAEEALALARCTRPHAITLDLMMPGQDGWELLQTLLNQPETQHIPVIVCSVLKQKELALSLGATAFLEKPVTEQALLTALAALEEPEA